MRIVRMKTDHKTNPLGFELEHPFFSWVVESEDTAARRAEAARVEISLAGDFQTLAFDSGRREGLHGFFRAEDFLPEAYTRYYWRVTVWTENGEIVRSEPAWFETAKRNDPWQAKWISPPFEAAVHPYFRREFTLPEDFTRARAYVCGLGLYELEINGQKAGEEYLAPGFHAYDFWLQYQTYDITELLRPGTNAVGAMLGNGWYKGRFGFDGGYTELYGGAFALICELRVERRDGSVLVLGTDGAWMCRESPVLSSGIYDGEVYDAAREVPGWSCAGLDDSGWAPALLAALGTEKLTARHSLPVRVMERRKAALLRTPAGEMVLDFGQNMAGWVEFESALPAGAQIVLQYGEILQGGNFYNDNLRTAKAEFRYISNGTRRHVRPHFTYYGFRYVKLTGFPEPDPADFTACVLYSALERTGSVETSDSRVNQLFQNALWSQKGNFLDVPTDCPQRDERMGWTGDAQAFCGTASFNMDTAAFYEKYLTDLAFEQTHFHGSVPFVVPSIKPEKPVGNIDLRTAHGSCAWGDAATVIPWTLYLFYGDAAMLRRQYGSMKAWVDYIRRQDENSGGARLWKTGFHFADWLALDNPDPASPLGGTDPFYIASAYYCLSASLVAKAARALGEKGDARAYGRLAEEVRAAVRMEYFSADGFCRPDTQTALVVALVFRLVPEEWRAQTVERLLEKLRERGMHLSTGFVGTPLLCRALSENGAHEAAVSLLLQEECPGWLYEVGMGATTVWERWNSILPDGRLSDTGMNSLNHYAYGSVVEWMYHDLCGIRPSEEAPGFRKATLAPQPDRRLRTARARYDSPAGTWESGWKYIEDDTVAYTFRVPFDTQAAAFLPAAVPEKTRCGTMLLAESGLEYRIYGGGVEVALPSGKWEICVEETGASPHADS